MIAVTQVGKEKVDVQYLVDTKTKEVKRIDAVTVSTEAKKEYYSETTNKYGEVTVTSNNVEEITTQLPTVQTGIAYIQENYPIIAEKPVEMVKVIEYPKIYQVNYVSHVD